MHFKGGYSVGTSYAFTSVCTTHVRLCVSRVGVLLSSTDIGGPKSLQAAKGKKYSDSLHPFLGLRCLGSNTTDCAYIMTGYA